MAPKPIGSSAQYQDITQVLKGITDFYPPESCLRELLQNADDAGATEIEYVLDTRTYVTDPGHLIDPSLQEFQGPALLARNNAVFTESDIRSLCSVGVSGKRDDILVAGKFGRGFNSVYHWTDNPSIYSENRLLFQDPQHSWADSGGSVYETVHAPDDTEDPNCDKAKAQLQAFSQFPFDINSPYPGTIIRIPLRTGNQASTSKICRKETTTQQIRKFLLRFAQELGESGLLFVKHITKVTLRVDKEELSVTQVLNVDEVCLSRQQVLHSLKSREDCSKSLEMEIRHFLGVNVSPQNRRYVIQHVLRRGSGDQSLDDWAREGKLLPWVAVAVQVNPLGSHPCSPKPLSSTLCLPKKIKQPAYMHGLWAIAPDRQRLSTESSGESWNKYLFSTLIATAWKDLLLYRNPLSPTNERFQFWPNPVETIEDPWDGLYDTIVESAINEDLPIWNTAFNCVNSKDAFFAEQKLENDNSAPALAKIGMPVVYLPSALYVLIREAPVKLQTLQPATALAYLHANIDKLLLASPEMKIKLLEYCFAAKAFAQLAEIPIWPLLSGSFANLKKSLTFLPRSVDEMELFRRSKPDLTIDVSKLTSQALKAMHHNHDKLFKETPMRYRAITDLIEEWPTLYPISESSGFHVGRPTRLDKTLQGLWAWVSQRGSEIQEEDIVTVMGSFPDSLFLFPLRGDFVRHFASKSQDMPTLIVMDKELEALLVQVTKGSDVPPGILDESILQKAGLGLAERIGSKLPATQIETSENLFGFAPWLAAAKDLLLDLSDEDRRLLIKHISRVTKKRYDPSHGSMIANFLRQLPIFRKVVPRISVAGDDTSSFDYTWIDLSENHEYVSIANLPAVPTQTGVTFIDVSMAGMEKLARTFGLAKTLSVESLLRDYVLPAIEGKSIEKVSEKRLIEFILEASAGCSNEWRQTLAKARVIPSRSLENTRDLRAPRDLYDPTSRNLQRLFFMDETVFPDSDIFKTYHILLKQCGLHTEISSDIIKSRIRYFEKTRSPLQELEDKVSYLVQTPLTPHELRDKAFMIEVQSKRWVPAFTGPTMVKLSPKDCRPSGLAWLVSQTHGLVRFSVSPSWHQLLGWDKAIDFQTLLKQLSKLIEENKVLEVQKLLDYIEERCSPEEYVPELTSMRCIPGSQGLYVPSKVFSSENRDLSRLSPHVDILHPAVTFSQIHKNLGVQGEFTLETLLTVQECILTPGLFLSNQDLDIAVAILHLASSFPRDQLADLMGPTQDCKMVNIAELTIGGDKERLSEFQSNPYISYMTGYPSKLCRNSR